MDDLLTGRVRVTPLLARSTEHTWAGNSNVEKPFVAQLQALGWTHIEGSLDDPAVTGRASFAEVIQEGVLREQLRALNLGPMASPGWTMPGCRRPWAPSPARGAQADGGQPGSHRAADPGLTVEGLPGWDGGRGQTIQLHRLGHPAPTTASRWSTSTASIARPASTRPRPSSCPTWCCW